MAAHVPTQPTHAYVSGGMNKTFLSSLNFLDRSFSDKLIEKYGPESYTMILDMIGRKIKVENNSFYHYEKRRTMNSVQVASVTGGTTGATASVTIASGSHTDSGTKSPIRVGEVFMISASGIMGKVISVSTTTPSAHVASIAPLKSTEAFNPGANDWLLSQGMLHVGEASTVTQSLQPLTDKITNTVTQVREDYDITDLAAMERIEWKDPNTGQNYYKYFGTAEAEKRFLNSREFLTVFGTPVTNTNITSNGTVGTRGLLDQVAAFGSDLSYTAGSMAITDFQSVSRELSYNGASSELHVLSDIRQHQEITRLLFSTYNNGAILWDSVGGSAEAAAKYGFMSLQIDGFTYHFKKYAPFSPEWTHGVAPATAPNYRNYGVIIPQGYSNQIGGKTPTISLRYMEPIAGVEVNAYEHGGLALTNKTGEQKLYNTMIGHYGVQVAAANQCVIFQA